MEERELRRRYALLCEDMNTYNALCLDCPTYEEYVEGYYDETYEMEKYYERRDDNE